MEKKLASNFNSKRFFPFFVVSIQEALLNRDQAEWLKTEAHRGADKKRQKEKLFSPSL